MPDNPGGGGAPWWQQLIGPGLDFIDNRWGGGGGGGAASILPRDPDQSVDWESVFGLPDTDRSAAPGVTAAGCAITLPVRVTQRAVCPPGYVVVHPEGQGKQCMLKSVAIDCKLYKEPATPPIKASDWRCLKRSASVVRKLDTVARTANRITGKASLTRSRKR